MKLAKKINGQLAGELTLKKVWRNEWEIQYLSIEPQHRGKKIATDLLEMAKSYAIKNGLMLVAFVDPKRDGGMTSEQIKEWLKRHGFKHGWYDFFNHEKGNNKRVLIFNGC